MGDNSSRRNKQPAIARSPITLPDQFHIRTGSEEIGTSPITLASKSAGGRAYHVASRVNQRIHAIGTARRDLVDDAPLILRLPNHDTIAVAIADPPNHFVQAVWQTRRQVRYVT